MSAFKVAQIAEVNMPSIMTPLQINAAAGLIQNQGISSSTVTIATGAYLATPLLTPFNNTITVATAGNILTPSTLTQVQTLAANSCPALSDSIPAGNAASYSSHSMTSSLNTTAKKYLGNGDLSKFAQAVSISQGYSYSTNQIINSTVNSQNYLAGTFTNFNDMISGGITAVNVCTPQWASDLANLGSLINLAQLPELGTPLALIKQLAALGGIVPEISEVFTKYGVSDQVVINLTDPSLTAGPADQKAMYTAMTNITGVGLSQALKIFGVTTANINTMADLLNPYKIFPNSYQTLTVIDVNNVSQKIYINSSGGVNGTLVQTLPAVALSQMV